MRSTREREVNEGMKSRLFVVLCGALLVAGIGTAQAEDRGTAGPAGGAAAKTLPRLLIKGEVVSVDSSDPSAVLLKVKDRYGFETPIYVTPDAKVTQGDTQASVTNLAAGTPVGVEYNFDVNTAKRHAVSVKVEPAAPAAAPAMPAAPAPDATAPAAPATPEASSAAPVEAPAASEAPAAAPASAPSEEAPASQ